MSGYVYDQAFEHERARLAGMEAQWDPGTFRHIDGLGLKPGASCWEIGGGGGSVAAWLETVAGHLLVTDVDTRFIESLASDQVTVERHDVVVDPLPDERFDLIHARLVLEHLPARDAVVDRLVEALSPGGWLLLEDYDWTSYGAEPGSEATDRVTQAVLGLMKGAGFDPYFGRRLLGELETRGLKETGAEGRSLVMSGGHPGIAFYRFSLLSLRDPLVSSGAVTEADVEEVLAEIDREDRTLISPVMIAAWGRSSPGG
jgi:SAM-dependent methyltransferase